ncbi:unnamed protein product [Acanthoscelides obtectus]|uniref:Uncharacterized protein n=1 Tax=Acanthoscelides obtectus TaxID=200917 RepID=A0A9P0KYC6_ACAOB|nr:unnamed protein product [Acanthoscelides obtectus]CAK1659102.1 hypothetical protein AOBTE_LOCUS21278 [Acanthoscelides obtectus]
MKDPEDGDNVKKSTPTDTLTLILNQLSTMASDIKDIKNSQSQLRTDVAYCRNLLQQHSDSISRHDDLIAACETNIQNIQVTQTELSSNIANIESRLARSMETMHSGNGASSTPIAPSSQAETMELFRRSHNIILRGIAEGNDDINIIYKRRPAYRLKRQHKQEVISDNLTKCVEERITPCIAFLSSGYGRRRC